MLNTLSLFLGLSVAGIAAAQEPDREFSRTNVTVAFFTQEQGPACNGGDISDSLVFTTSTQSGSQVCFNLDELFGGNSTSGFTNGSSSPLADSNIEDYYGVRWRLENMDLYDSAANYSRLWTQQVNLTGPPADDEVNEEAGEDGTWDILFYPGEDCSDLGSDIDETPWILSNCQTELAGECGQASYSVKSFIVRLRAGVTAEGECAMFEPWGDSAGSRLGASLLGLTMGAILTTWLVM